MNSDQLYDVPTVLKSVLDFMQKMDNGMSSIETSVTKINSVDEKLTKLTTSFSMLSSEVKDIKARCTELEDSQRGLGNLIEKVQKKCETNI